MRELGLKSLLVVLLSRLSILRHCRDVDFRCARLLMHQQHDFRRSDRCPSSLPRSCSHQRPSDGWVDENLVFSLFQTGKGLFWCCEEDKIASQIDNMQSADYVFDEMRPQPPLFILLI
jgi:hypothetical protein